MIQIWKLPSVSSCSRMIRMVSSTSSRNFRDASAISSEYKALADQGYNTTDVTEDKQTIREQSGSIDSLVIEQSRPPECSAACNAARVRSKSVSVSLSGSSKPVILACIWLNTFLLEGLFRELQQIHFATGGIDVLCCCPLEQFSNLMAAGERQLARLL